MAFIVKVSSFVDLPQIFFSYQKSNLVYPCLPLHKKSMFLQQTKNSKIKIEIRTLSFIVISLHWFSIHQSLQN